MAGKSGKPGGKRKRFGFRLWELPKVPEPELKRAINSTAEAIQRAIHSKASAKARGRAIARHAKILRRLVTAQLLRVFREKRIYVTKTYDFPEIRNTNMKGKVIVSVPAGRRPGIEQLKLWAKAVTDTMVEERILSRKPPEVHQ